MNTTGNRNSVQANRSVTKTIQIPRNGTKERIPSGQLVQQELGAFGDWYREQRDNTVIHNNSPAVISPTDIDEGVGGLVGRGETQSAREKRSSYRTKSSGYGTESSHGSYDKSRERFESDVFEDIYTASENVDATGAISKVLTKSSDTFSDKESLSCSSCNSNSTVIDTHDLSRSNCSLSDIGHSRNVAFTSKNQRNVLRTEKEDDSLKIQMTNNERLLSDHEPSFEILLSSNNGAENVKDEVPQSDNTDFSSLFEDVALLRKYISKQQHPAVYESSSEASVNISPGEVDFNQQQMNSRNEPLQQEWFLQSLTGFDDNICSIVPSNDTHVPHSEMERMYSSAMRRLNKQAKQQDLQKLFAAIDKEDTVEIYQEIEKLTLDSDQKSIYSLKAGKI